VTPSGKPVINSTSLANKVFNKAEAASASNPPSVYLAKAASICS